MAVETTEPVGGEKKRKPETQKFANRPARPPESGFDSNDEGAGPAVLNDELGDPDLNALAQEENLEDELLDLKQKVLQTVDELDRTVKIRSRWN